MELHHLRHFVAVAEELHFGRAAVRLRMAQPPLSQSIQRLEASLGIELLVRTRHGVTLTLAGRVLLDESRHIISRTDRALSLARRAAVEVRGQLRIGITPIAVYSMVPRVAAVLRARSPSIRITLTELDTQAQIEALLEDYLDVGVFPYWGNPVKGLEMRSLARSRFVAAVPSAWPLAIKKEIELVELSKWPWVMHDKAANPGVHAAIHDVCRTAGFVPNVVQRANQAHALLSLVSSEFGVRLVSTSQQMPLVEGVTYVPVVDLPGDLYIDTMLAWAQQQTSPLLTSFVAMLEELSGSH